LYQPSAKKVAVVDVPDFLFVMIDGRMEKGKSPGESPAFREAMMALYGAAYTLKFMSKLRKKNPVEYPVMALEGLWWVAGVTFDIAPARQLALPGDDDAPGSHHGNDVRRSARQNPGQAAVAFGGKTPPGAVPRGAVHPDDAHRAVRRRTGDGRTAADFRRGERFCIDRLASRDLHERSAPHGAGEAEDRFTPSGEENVTAPLLSRHPLGAEWMWVMRGPYKIKSVFKKLDFLPLTIF
jgi:hypothetical protein